jgi:putative DNA-invertase from lambdoid prophage Rac
MMKKDIGDEFRAALKLGPRDNPPSETIAALYGRVSTKRQSCVVQMNEIREWCARHGWPIYKEYEDWGVSGRKAVRPGLTNLMRDAKDGRFKVLVIYRLDRFGRSLSDVIHNILELDAAKVRLVSVIEGLDTNDKSPMGRFLVQMLAAMAEMEVNVMQERIQDGVEYAREHGTKSGKSIGRQKVIFRVDKALDLRNEGLSWRQVHRELRRQGIKVGLGTLFSRCSESLARQQGRFGVAG